MGSITHISSMLSHLHLSMLSQAVLAPELLTLAASGRSKSAMGAISEIFFYGSIMAVAVFVLIIIAFKLRHWIKNDDPSDTGEIFSISQLRELRDKGDLSEEEFENTKRVLVAHGLKTLST